MKFRFIFTSFACVLALSCSDESSTNNANNANNANNTNNSNNTNNMADMGSDGDMDAEPDPEAICDPLDPAACSLPWPSNLYLAQDGTRTTGYTLEFGPHTLPANKAGQYINPEPYKRMDGYGLGSPAIVNFPNLDVTGLPDEYNVARSLNPTSPIVFLEISDQGATRLPFYTDHDAWSKNPEEQVLIVRPAVVLKPNTRYAVAFRNLVDTDGKTFDRTTAFDALITGNTADIPELASRQARFDEVFGYIESIDGWTKDELILAYDFHTASDGALHGWLLKMRDEALAAEPNGPTLVVTSVEEFTVQENEDTAVRIKGTFETPNYIKEVPYLTRSIKMLNIGADGTPTSDGTRTATFWINIPHSAPSGPPHGLTMFGHGLFGSGKRAWADFNSRIANNHDLIYFGADLWGMSETQQIEDAGAVVTDLNYFPSLGDQLYQGMIEWVLLARAMKSQFAALPEVTSRNITMNPNELFYSGISQGGIFGPTFLALTPDITVGHAGVPGHTYSVLLHRSVDFEQFFQVLRGFYKSPIDQTLGLHTIQLLWSATDSVSYVRHLSQDPFDEGTTNRMLFAPAKGDFQVAVHQNEVLARTPGLGIAMLENYDSERTVDLVTPVPYPHTGSAVVLYDFEADNENAMAYRNAWPEPTNHPPVWGDQEACEMSCPVDESIERARFACCSGRCCFDAHELPRRRDWHNAQMVQFFRSGGEVSDVCGGDGCRPD